MTGLVVLALLVGLVPSVVPLAHAAATILTVIDFSPSRAGNIASNPVTNKVYVAREDEPAIKAIDGNTNAVVGSIGTAGYHTGLSVNSVTNRVYVSQQFASSVKVIDGVTDTGIADIAIPSVQTISFNAVDPGLNRLYVVRPNNGDIAVVDTSSNTVVDFVLSGCCGGATGLAVDTANHRLYVVSPGASSLLVVDAATAGYPILATVPLSSDGNRVAIHPTTKRVYITHASSNLVTMVDGLAGSPTENTILGTIAVGNNGADVQIDTITNRVYVTGSGSQTLSIISASTNTVIDTVSSVPNNSHRIALLPSLHRIYIPDDGLKGVSVVNDPRGVISLVHGPAYEFVGDTFTVNIVADAKNYAVDTADAYVDFDPAVLEVVTAGGALASSVELNTSAFPSATFNTVDNSTGKINLSASRLSAPYFTGSQTVATIRFRGKGASSGSTPVTLVRSGARQSDLLRGGDSVAETFTSASFAVYPKSTLNGQVRPDRRGASGTARWVTELFRDGLDGIKVFSVGGSTPLFTFQATTDNTGAFSVLLNGLVPGTYDFTIKPSNGLSVKKTSVTMPSASTVDFGYFRVGDANVTGANNDVVNGGDVSAISGSFLKCTGDGGFDRFADTNADGCINGSDVSALVPNFLNTGPTDGTANAVSLTSAAGAQAGSTSSGSLSLVPAATSLKVGETTTVTLRAVLGSTTADTVDAYIKVDPALLQIVPATGGSGISVSTQAFPATSVNRVSVSEGRIDLSATRFSPAGLSGTVDVATFTVRALAAGSASVDLVREGARQSDLIGKGSGQRAALTNITVVIDPARAQVGVSTSQTSGGLRVAITAGCGTIHQLQIGRGGPLANASVDVEGGPSNITSTTTYTPTSAATTVYLRVRRVTPGVAVTVPLVVTDDCGSWPTFVGGGVNAGF